MKAKYRQTVCMVIILFLIFSFIPLLGSQVLGKNEKPKKPKKGTVVSVFVNYDDTALEGSDVGIEGLELNIAVDSVMIDSVFTDVDGIALIYITQAGDYELKYSWQGSGLITFDIDESTSNSDEIELSPWTLGSGELEFLWSHDLSAFTDALDLLKWNGATWDIITNVDPDGAGKLVPLAGVSFGTYMFAGATDNFTIVMSDAQPIPDFTTYITPTRRVISTFLMRINPKRGI